METSFIVILLLNEYQNQTSSKGSGKLWRLEIKRMRFATKGSENLWWLEIERTRFVSPRADRTLLLSHFQEVGCKAPQELYTHQIKSKRSEFDFRRVLPNLAAVWHRWIDCQECQIAVVFS